ncbi:MAG TPA: glycoside hydrolase family 15 protein [Gemmatimonadales bacterium]|jgi:GH15 family glucan-1,4-alpha-glucosidase
MSSLDLGLIGNGSIGALINPLGEVVWACFPRFDGDPMFCTLLRSGNTPDEIGCFAIDLLDVVRSEQEYLLNTAILVTRLYDKHGGAIEITDFAPRFDQYDRVFCPMTLVRQARRLTGNPRVRIRIRPAYEYGRLRTTVTFGSNHIRYQSADLTLRLTTDVPVSAVLEENIFLLEEPIALILGPDESVLSSVADVAMRFRDDTARHWQTWVRSLAIPFEWQDDVIRAAITLKLNTFEDTGAIIAAMTTSIPESPESGRNWDYRYCWLRDAYFVINALNRLGATRTMERYIEYIANLAAGSESWALQPVYGITGRAVPDERTIDSLPGYRGMGPVRAGNQAHEQIQHDVYGSAILATAHVFFDQRLVHRGGESLFRRLEPLGERAASLFDRPDAGIWELRGIARVHTFSSVMCWAACDRLARIAKRLGASDRAIYWQERAKAIHNAICEKAWNPSLNSFASTFGGSALDASLLHMNDVGFLAASDPRFTGTVRAIEKTLRRGAFLLRYDEQDDFGTMDNAFLVCTFWHIDALAAIGERDKARDLFETVLARRNRHGLFAEDIDPRTGEQWGNFPQTYSMVGLINSALRLSIRWDQAV